MRDQKYHSNDFKTVLSNDLKTVLMKVLQDSTMSSGSIQIGEKTFNFRTEKDGTRLVFGYDDSHRLVAISAHHVGHGKASPPSSAILSALLSVEISEDVIDNLNELFESRWLPRHGPVVARCIWRMQAAQIIVRRWAEPIVSFLLRLRGLIRS